MELFSKQRHTHASAVTPVVVQIAAIAIITTRCLDLLMLFSLLGMHGMLDLVHRSVQTWNLTLIFLASLLLLFIELRCAFAIMKGRNQGRWCYLATRLIAGGYLWAASLGYGYPELFSVTGETQREIVTTLFLQKLPDLLVLTLLFVPATSRRFFARR